MQQIEQAARAQLARQADAAGWREARFEVAVAPAIRSPAGPCRGAVEVEPQDTRQAHRMRFVAVCPGADGWRREYVARAAVSALVGVLQEPLAAGAALERRHMTLERRDITQVGDAIGEPGALAGLVSARALRPGELLRAGQFAAPLLVRRGDAVRIVARVGQIEVSMAGEALENGVLGAPVRVRNASSGGVIRARVSGAGTVQPTDLPAIQSDD